MAFGRLERLPRPAPMADINMTPLIDVMLVLLVVFMLTAPLMMTSSLRLDLPEAAAAQPVDSGAAVNVAIDARGTLTLADAPVDVATLSRRLHEVAARDPQTEVQLRADKAVPYGQVAQLIGVVQAAGLTRIGFVAEPASGAAPSARQ